MTQPVDTMGDDSERMADPEPPPERPKYRVYRSRKPLLPGRQRDELAELRSGRARTPGRTRKPLSWGRVLRWLALAVAGWIVLSILAFLVSAQIQQGKIGGAANDVLGGAGYPLWSANNILVLGSDQRTAATREPGAQTGVGRSDSIMLLRVGGGANARLSIARDTVVDIPGAGRQKINAAFAIGGTALAVRTVEAYTGVDVNHVVVVSFENFPALIDAMGGITYQGGCVVSKINGGFRNGGYTLRLPAGRSHIDGKQALALARTRHNACNKRESDLTRAHRQQKVIAAMRRRLLSPGAFARLPFVSWRVPSALRSDMSGPTLLGLFGALAVAGSPHTQVLGTFDGNVSASAKDTAVRRFLAG
jgi:LCP family protein required for cell wall assembly